MLAEVERNVEWIVEESNDGYHFVASESATVRGTVGYCTVKCFLEAGVSLPLKRQ